MGFQSFVQGLVVLCFRSDFSISSIHDRCFVHDFPIFRPTSRSPRTHRATTEDPRPLAGNSLWRRCDNVWREAFVFSSFSLGSTQWADRPLTRREGSANGSTKPPTRESGSRGVGKRETVVVDDHEESHEPRIMTHLASSRWMTQKEQSLYYRMVRDSYVLKENWAVRSNPFTTQFSFSVRS